jgi:sugar/nucleoside kinase (ribokinase family)
MNNTSVPLAAARLLRSAAALDDSPALVGFDGFIDTICDVVDRRHSATDYDRVATLKAYGERIVAASGQSANVEVVPTMVKLGGNGPIMANALAGLGVPVTYCGMTGYPQTHAVFSEFSERARLLPLAEPALTDAYEFDDGKLIVGQHATVAEVTFENLLDRVGWENFQEAWQNARFVGMVNWTMLPFMTRLWMQLLDRLPADEGQKKLLFFDLADPEKRNPADSEEALGTIGAFARRCDVILGLNEKEARQVGKVLKVGEASNEALSREDAKGLAAAIQAKLNVGAVVIHPTRFAAAATAQESAAVEGPWIASPKISTGAGDLFNAGFCLGRLLGASLPEALQVGVATSGFYVRQAQSPNREQLAGFLETL